MINTSRIGDMVGALVEKGKLVIEEPTSKQDENGISDMWYVALQDEETGVVALAEAYGETMSLALETCISEYNDYITETMMIHTGKSPCRPYSLSREQAEELKEAINFFAHGGELYGMNDEGVWFSQNEVKINSENPVSNVIYDKHFEARKAFALGLEVEWRIHHDEPYETIPDDHRIGIDNNGLGTYRPKPYTDTEKDAK